MTISSTDFASGDATSQSTVTLAFELTNGSYTLAQEDILITVDGTTTDGLITAFDSSAMTATIDASNTNAEYRVVVEAGESNLRSNTIAWVYDDETPTISSLVAASYSSNSGAYTTFESGASITENTVQLTLTASEAVTYDESLMVVSDDSVALTIADGADATEKIVTITTTTEKMYTFTLKAGAIQDAAGNTNAEATTFSWTYDFSINAYTSTFYLYKDGENNSKEYLLWNYGDDYETGVDSLTTTTDETSATIWRLADPPSSRDRESNSNGEYVYDVKIDNNYVKSAKGYLPTDFYYALRCWYNDLRMNKSTTTGEMGWPWIFDDGTTYLQQYYTGVTQTDHLTDELHTVKIGDSKESNE